jgi:hypothetical protein
MCPRTLYEVAQITKEVFMKISEALTWEELGEVVGGRFRTRSMDDVFVEAKNKDGIYFNEEEGTLHKIIEE